MEVYVIEVFEQETVLGHSDCKRDKKIINSLNYKPNKFTKRTLRTKIVD